MRHLQVSTVFVVCDRRSSGVHAYDNLAGSGERYQLGNKAYPSRTEPGNLYLDYRDPSRLKPVKQRGTDKMQENKYVFKLSELCLILKCAWITSRSRGRQSSTVS
jgi:hypothetical protein